MVGANVGPAGDEAVRTAPGDGMRRWQADQRDDTSTTKSQV